jgi:nucleotide-binding universal stress UspA family protein
MPETLLVGIDGSDASRRAAEFAAERARARQARLVLAYVIEWSPYSFNTPEENEQRHKRREDEIGRAHTQVIDPLIAALSGPGLEIDSLVRHGHAADVLTGLAKEVGASQLFIGRLGTSGIKALLFGSVAGSLVQISPVPVTVVP